ncbi:DUF2975 domain-containing protein [Sphingosinicella sp.]|uniref:DUF2975 domain-containing protein n=1 Tax=Sphingosinicella sp. TaxID=1917971 RepID=UPI0040381D6C
MTRPYSAALPIAYVVLRLLILVNWLGGVAIFVLLTATIVAEQWTLTALGITAASGIPAMLVGLRAIAALGLVGVLLNDLVLRRLVAIVMTVRRGDPFVAANAVRLQAIAWALLALQLLSMTIGAVGMAISTPENPVALDAGFSINGWLAVLLTFVLARIFAEGALMRDDLKGTV